MIVMTIIWWVLFILLIVTVIALIHNSIEMRRLERSIRNKRHIEPFVTVYTYEDGTKVYENCDGSVEVESPTDDNNGDEV